VTRQWWSSAVTLTGHVRPGARLRRGGGPQGGIDVGPGHVRAAARVCGGGEGDGLSASATAAGAVGAVEFGRAGRAGVHRGRGELGVGVRRWPAGDAIKPWRFRSWIFPRDKDFAVKPGRVLDPLDRTLCRLAKVLVPVLRVDGLVPGDFEFGNDVVVQKFVEPASHCVALSQPPTQPVVDA
jgi:hypothetical protein